MTHMLCGALPTEKSERPPQSQTQLLSVSSLESVLGKGKEGGEGRNQRFRTLGNSLRNFFSLFIVNRKKGTQ